MSWYITIGFVFCFNFKSAVFFIDSIGFIWSTEIDYIYNVIGLISKIEQGKCQFPVKLTSSIKF